MQGDLHQAESAHCHPDHHPQDHRHYEANGQASEADAERLDHHPVFGKMPHRLGHTPDGGNDQRSERCQTPVPNRQDERIAVVRATPGPADKVDNARLSPPAPARSPMRWRLPERRLPPSEDPPFERLENADLQNDHYRQDQSRPGRTPSTENRENSERSWKPIPLLPPKTSTIAAALKPVARAKRAAANT